MFRQTQPGPLCFQLVSAPCPSVSPLHRRSAPPTDGAAFGWQCLVANGVISLRFLIRVRPPDRAGASLACSVFIPCGRRRIAKFNGHPLNREAPPEFAPSPSSENEFRSLTYYLPKLPILPHRPIIAILRVASRLIHLMQFVLQKQLMAIDASPMNSSVIRSFYSTQLARRCHVPRIASTF